MALIKGVMSCSGWMTAYLYPPSVPANTAHRPLQVWLTASHSRRTLSGSMGGCTSSTFPAPRCSSARRWNSASSSPAHRAFRLCTSPSSRSTAWAVLSGFTDSSRPTALFCCQLRERYSSARWPHSSSRRTPSRNFCQPMNFTSPTWPDRDTWVPQQAHISAPGNWVMRTWPVSSFLLR